MVEYGIIQSGDAKAAENAGAIAGHPNLADYVQEGLRFQNPDWTADPPTIEVTAGTFVVLLETAVAEWSDDAGNNYQETRHLVAQKAHIDAHTSSGPNPVVDLTDGGAFGTAGERHIHAVFDTTEDDMPYLSVEAPDATVRDDAVDIGTVDTAAETVNETARDPSAAFEMLEAETASIGMVSGSLSVEDTLTARVLSAQDGVQFNTYATLADVPDGLPEGVVVYVENEGELFIEEGT